MRLPAATRASPRQASSMPCAEGPAGVRGEAPEWSSGDEIAAAWPRSLHPPALGLHALGAADLHRGSTAPRYRLLSAVVPASASLCRLRSCPTPIPPIQDPAQTSLHSASGVSSLTSTVEDGKDTRHKKQRRHRGEQQSP